MQVNLIISSFPHAPNGNIYSSTASLTLPYTVDCGVVRPKGHNIDSNSTRLSLIRPQMDSKVLYSSAIINRCIVIIPYPNLNPYAPIGKALAGVSCM